MPFDMPQGKQKVLVILGQTATGKSNLAVETAQKFNGEVISADSRQVYKGLDIGTGKITKNEMHGVSHHLLDVVNPKKVFSVSDYKKHASFAIKEILKKNKVPIICGGTGFYIDAVTKGIILPAVPPNKKLRQELEKMSASLLLKILQKLDRNRAETIDKNNKVRLIRAIEIAKYLGKVPKIKQSKPEYKFIKIGLYLPQDKLEKKVKLRVSKMFREGLLKEIEKLKHQGVSKKRLREFGFEYNDPTLEKVVKETLKYAKRQMMWFKRDKEIKWFEPGEQKAIFSYLKNELDRAGQKQKQ